MKKSLSPPVLYGALAAGLLLYALVGWFVLVGPKRSEASRLDKELATTEASIQLARAALERQDDGQPIAVADIFRLAKAMPNVADMPGILLELSRLADETGIEFRSITPQPPVVVDSFQQVPISLVFDGNFYELSDLLFRLRTLVGVRSGELHALGRLFSVQTLDFAESQDGFPSITATLTVNAYVYGTEVVAAGAPPAAVAPPPAAAEGTSTTGSEASGGEGADG